MKKAILHRKNSLFYKTRNGAHVGDIYMSLIYICELNGANALDHLNQLQLNASTVAEHPESLDALELSGELSSHFRRCVVHDIVVSPSSHRPRRRVFVMRRETIDIQLTPKERSLLLRYGYPFEQIEHALKNCEGSHDIEIVPMDCFELERLIGDVCRGPSTT